MGYRYGDRTLLEIIRNYCIEIVSAVDRFSIDRAVVTNDPDFRALIAFFILQIGETAKKLSREFTESHSEIEWVAICAFRNYIVHEYSNVDPDILWDTVEHDIPELKEFCEKVLKK